MVNKIPAFQFYPSDWRSDNGVQALNYFERGVWFEMLCLMHESEQRGKLLLNGNAIPEEALARLLRLDRQALSKTLTALIEFGVCSRDESGVLFSRRMVKDEAERQANAERQRKHYEKKQVEKPNGQPNGNLTAIQQKSNNVSSSSSSSSEEKDKTNVLSKKKRACALPADFEISAAMREWAATNAPRIGVESETEKFKDYHTAKGSTAVDWIAAWRTWLRNAEDWFKDGGKKKETPPAPPIPLATELPTSRDAEMLARGFPKMGGARSC